MCICTCNFCYEICKLLALKIVIHVLVNLSYEYVFAKKSQKHDVDLTYTWVIRKVMGLVLQKNA